MGELAQIQDKLHRRFVETQEEVEGLRTIYGDGFVLLGIHENEEDRIRNLSSQSRMTRENAKVAYRSRSC